MIPSHQSNSKGSTRIIHSETRKMLSPYCPQEPVYLIKCVDESRQSEKRELELSLDQNWPDAFVAELSVPKDRLCDYCILSLRNPR